MFDRNSVYEPGAPSEEVTFVPRGQRPPPDALYRQLRKWNRQGDEAYYRGAWALAAERFTAVVQKYRATHARQRTSKVHAVCADAARNLAMLNLLRGERAAFEGMMLEARKAGDRTRDRDRWLVACDNAMASAYAARQEGHFRDAMAHMDGIPPPETEADADYLVARRAIELANVARNLGLFRESAALLSPLLDAVSPTTMEAGRRPEAPQVLSMMAWHFVGVTWMERAVYHGDDAARAQADVALRRSLDLARRGSSPSLYSLYVVRNQKALGWLLYCEGDHAAAAEAARTSAREARALGDTKTQCLALTLLAAAQLELGGLAECGDALRQALEMSEQIGYWRGRVAAWFYLGQRAARGGDDAGVRAAVDRLRGLAGDDVNPLIAAAIEGIHASWSAPAPDDSDVRLAALYDAQEGAGPEGASDRGEVTAEVRRLEGLVARRLEADAARGAAELTRAARARMDEALSAAEGLLRERGVEVARDAEGALATLRGAVGRATNR